MNKLTKLIIISVAVCSLSTQALAHGGERGGGRGYGGGYGLGLGIITGLAVGALAGSYAYQSYPVYQQPAYQPYYPPQVVYVAPPVQQCTNVVNQVVMNGYVQNVYSVACLQPNGQWMVVR